MPRNEFDQPIGEPVAHGSWPVVGPVSLSGQWCRLEPWSGVHLEHLYDAAVRRSPPNSWTYLDTPPLDRPAGLAAWLDGLDADPGAVPLVICDAGGSPIGTASYLRLDHLNGSVEVGAVAFSAELQRTTAATEAMFLMMRHAFDDLGYRRYEWKCDSLNEPSRRAAERLGFTYEGTFRNAVVYKGRNRDTAWFSITDREWPAVRARFETWLSAANFDAHGVQLTPLRGR